MDEPVPSKADSGKLDAPAPGDEAHPGRVVALSEHQLLATSYSGPVPPPSILQGYEKLVPGSAARILAQAERQTDHRIHLEKTVVESDVRRSWVGLWLGFIISMTIIVGGCILVGLGHDAAGAGIATGGVAALAGVFVYGTTIRQRELRRKSSQAPPPSDAVE